MAELEQLGEHCSLCRSEGKGQRPATHYTVDFDGRAQKACLWHAKQRQNIRGAHNTQLLTEEEWQERTAALKVEKALTKGPMARALERGLAKLQEERSRIAETDAAMRALTDQQLRKLGR